MRSFRRRTLATAIGTLVAALALTACTGGNDGYAIFDREATAADQPPQEILDQMSESDPGGVRPEPETARLAGTYDGVSVWLVNTDTPGYVCLIADPQNGPEWVAGCALESGGVSAPGVGTFHFHPGDEELPSNGTAISENVYVLHGLD
ncbi:hypothetical protein IT882_06955 [Microbacterium schleiferi]|uniref:Lipoprotein n=1 Tax=Microbacterium schleiferi TaxID=69362 RepID=A0A7S8MYQ2_9MICO|nr:hypothetical protein [Microbacterium schleiferi]QPE05714.1 hypothetical protein IT882_06955 [Microbacterium schleiferi]